MQLLLARAYSHDIAADELSRRVSYLMYTMDYEHELLPVHGVCRFHWHSLIKIYYFQFLEISKVNRDVLIIISERPIQFSVSLIILIVLSLPNKMLSTGELESIKKVKSQSKKDDISKLRGMTIFS